MRLTDAALTNAVAISGLAQVKWRCIITRPESPPSSVQSDCPVDDPLLATYRQLLASGVACHWRIVKRNTTTSSSIPKTLNDNTIEATDSTADMMAVDYDAHDDATNNNNDEPTNTASMTTPMEDIAILQHELWLFWWGQEEPALSIDVEQTESRLGSFSWDAISSSTGAASRLPIHLAVTLPEECDLFLEALRNLCTRGLAHQHIISLGNLFIFDGLNHHRSSTISDNRLDGFRLHIQITASNVLLLPERCQLPIRRLTADDLHYTEAESHLYLPVKLSPFGINGQLLKHHEVYRPICDTLAEQQLDRWSTLHAIPLDVLRAPMTSNLPLFVMIRIGNMVLSYPTALVFPLIDTNDSALSSSNDTPHLSSVLRVSIRDPVKMNAWSYVDHCNNLASAVLAQCAAHEPTSLGESPNNSEWKPVIIDSASNIDATKQSNVANKSVNEDEIMTQLCDIFQTAPPSNNESVTAVASSNLGGSITTPNDTGVGTPAPTLNTLGSNISSNVNDESRRTSGLSALDGLNDFYNFVDDPDTEMVTEDDFNFFDDDSTNIRSMETSHASDIKNTTAMNDMLTNSLLTSMATTTASINAATATSLSNVDLSLATSTIINDAAHSSIIADMENDNIDHMNLPGSNLTAVDTTTSHIDSANALLTPKDTHHSDGVVSPAFATTATTTATTAITTTTISTVCDDMNGTDSTSHQLASPLSLSELRTALIPVEFAPLVDDTTIALDAKYRHGGRYAYMAQNTPPNTDIPHTTSSPDDKMPYTVDYQPRNSLKSTIDSALMKLKGPSELPTKHKTNSMIVDVKLENKQATTTSTLDTSNDNDDNNSDSSSYDSSSSDSECDVDDVDLVHCSDASQIAIRLAIVNDKQDTSDMTMSSSSTITTSAVKLFNKFKEVTWREFTWQAIYSLNLHQLIQQSNVCTTLLEQGEEYAIVNTISQVAEQLFIQDESHKSPQRTHSTVRGQLTVKQLYELYESGQPQSKYGRYQVRKRTHKQGCIEPITDEPEIIVHQQEQTLALNATAIRFWEALRLEPFGGKKTLIPVMLCPVGDAMEASARQMIKEISAVYEACLLGTHRAINGMEVVPVILLPSMTEESTYNRQLRSLTAAFEKLGGQLPAPTNRDTSTIVIYVINPFPDHFKHLLAICQCFEAMVYAYRKRGLDAEQLALQIIPYQLVNNPNQRATDHAAVCKTLAFSAYTRAFRRLTVLDDHGLTFGCDYKRKSSKPAIPIYAPPYTLVNDALRKFELNLPADIHAPPLFRANHLHVAYTGPLVGSRMICVWTDDSGEVLESDSWIQSTTTATTIEESIKETVTQVWQRSQLMVQRWFNEPCSITIVRKGIMNSVEFEAWLAICGDDSPHVILACMADEPTLRIQLPTTERCSGEPPNGNIKSHTALAPDAGLLMKTVVGEVYLVDVGHRLAISNETIEPKNSVSSNYYRRQLLPLASGSLFWLPDAETLPDASTCRLQIHLLRSPSSVSANMTLRELLLRYYALSFIHFSPNFAWAPLPVHLRVLQQLVRLVECQSIS